MIGVFNMQTAAQTATLPGEFPVARFRLQFVAKAPYIVHGYRGSAWRGAFGTALKNQVCITRERYCHGCLVRHSCLYPYIFETEADPGQQGSTSVDQAPHPYVICAEPVWRQREVCGERVEITLLGRAVAHWTYVLQALSQGAERGLGLERVLLRLKTVEQETGDRRSWRMAVNGNRVVNTAAESTPAVPPMPQRVRVRLVTPMRVRRQGDLVEPERFGFDEFVAALLRRLALLSRFHTEHAWRLDHAGLTAIARKAMVMERQLVWQDWARYSTRQQKRIPMGGVVGRYVLETRGLERVWPLLWLGQWTHAGKGAVMGLGRYEVEEA